MDDSDRGSDPSSGTSAGHTSAGSAEHGQLDERSSAWQPSGLAAAGEDRGASITLLTTEHYNLQTARASTIGEANGRASIFLGAVSAGLIALGFQGTADSAAGTTFQVVVLSALTFLGLLTFLRCLEISVDDWLFSVRINRLRAVYAELLPQLAPLLTSAAGVEQATAMLTRRRQPFQVLLSVAGTVDVVASIVAGADVGALLDGLGTGLGLAIGAGVATGLLAAASTVRFNEPGGAGRRRRTPRPSRWADHEIASVGTAAARPDVGNDPIARSPR